MARLLIVSPQFHGYHESIARAFRSLGYDTSTFCYDSARSGGEKAWNKLRHELPAKLAGRGEHLSAHRASRRAILHLRVARPDLVLVIRGDVLSEEFWQEASAASRPVIVWMYDELRRTVFDAQLVSRYAAIATYSSGDAQRLRRGGLEVEHVPLGFDAEASLPGRSAGAGVVSFIGAPLPGRIAAMNSLVAAGVPVRAWGRGWSAHPADRARTWRLRDNGVPSARDVPSGVAHAIMRDSLATINIHGDQDGFTMRTFEACGVGAVQLIDRADVDELYQPGTEVLVFNCLDELVELARRVVNHPGDFDAIRLQAGRRTLAQHTLRHRAKALEMLWGVTQRSRP